MKIKGGAVKIIKTSKNAIVDNSKWYLLFTIMLGIGLLVYSHFFGENIDNKTFTANISKIIDGDTMEFIAGNKTIKCRAIGIDSPEKFNSSKLNNFAEKYNFDIAIIKEAGILSANFAKSFFSKDSHYEITTIGKDIYDRKLCIIKKGKQIYNKEIIKEGYAVVYKQGNYTKPYKLAVELNQLQYLAIESQKGLWNSHYDLMIKMANE